jgi:CubicO group peptidase (beta-lactamase class C family)
VIHAGAVEWSAAYGDASHDQPMSITTSFPVGELTMTLTGAAAVKLAQARKVGLDQDVSEYLAAARLLKTGAAQGQPVTLRELLSNTAGAVLDRTTGLQLAGPLPPNTLINQPVFEVNSVPGKVVRISSANYYLAQRAIEDAARASLTDYAATLFEPLGMTNSAFTRPSIHAVGHDQSGKLTGTEARAVEQLTAADGLWSTPSDVARLVLEMRKAARGEKSVLPKAVATEVLKSVGNTGAGLGVLAGGQPGHRFWRFSGTKPGYVCAFILYENGDGAVLMANGDNGSQLMDDVVRTISAVYGWPDFKPVSRTEVKVPQNILDRYIGYYRLGRYRFLEVVPNEDHLAINFMDGSSRPLYATAEQVWFLPDDGDIINFDLGTDGMAKAVTDHHGSLATAAVRLKPDQVPLLKTSLVDKLRDKKPDPSAQAMLAHYIDELRSGLPDYDGEMTPTVAAAQSFRLADYHNIVSRFGGLVSVRFEGVTDAGADIYKLSFEHGTLRSTVLVGDDDKMEALTLDMS